MENHEQPRKIKGTSMENQSKSRENPWKTRLIRNFVGGNLWLTVGLFSRIALAQVSRSAVCCISVQVRLPTMQRQNDTRRFVHIVFRCDKVQRRNRRNARLLRMVVDEFTIFATRYRERKGWSRATSLSSEHYISRRTACNRAEPARSCRPQGVLRVGIWRLQIVQLTNSYRPTLRLNMKCI